MYSKFILLLLTITVSYKSMGMPNVESVVYIGNGHVQVGILVEVGGTIVSLRYKNGENILESDSTLWNEPMADRPLVNANPVWKAYNGHTVWLGPQSDWWAQQDVNPELKKTKSNWPPDPWLGYANYKILQHTDSSLIIESPASPVSGVSVTKNISISHTGKVSIIVSLKNTGNKPVSWDIWMNTRMNGMDKAYVPISKNDDVRMDGGSPKTAVATRIADGYFTFKPARPEKEVAVLYSKAFIYPSKPFIAGFTKNYMLLIQFEKHNKSAIHPNQALVELYNSVAIDPKQDLLELEYHSPYKTLQPGEIMQAWETWEVHTYSGSDDQQQHIEFLNTIIN